MSGGYDKHLNPHKVKKQSLICEWTPPYLVLSACSLANAQRSAFKAEECELYKNYTNVMLERSPPQDTGHRSILGTT
eukprot:2430945-Amphidinium_carterae.3